MNEILQDLKTENNFAFGKLYKDNFEKISVFVNNNSGRDEDAEDIFQEAMIVLVQKLRIDHFKLTASINTYVFAICKNLWFKRLRDKNFHVSIEDLHDIQFQNSITRAIEDETSYIEKLKGYLMKISDHCNRMMHDIFYKNKSIKEIQLEYGYTSIHNAQNQKHKCVEQIRKVKNSDKN